MVSAACFAGDWPRWRGPDGAGISTDGNPPSKWDATTNVRWKVAIPGEGGSSPVVAAGRVFLTLAEEDGTKRSVRCLSLADGSSLWTRTADDPNPEITSALTGHAAATPVTDGERVVAFLGNAGLIAHDQHGTLLWRRPLGEFESELGLASSPILWRDLVIQVCDHDGKSFTSFDSFLIAVALADGQVRWRTSRRGLERSWSTPVLVPAMDGQHELVVNAQDELRGYDPESGELLWHVRGMTGWVAPSPVFGGGLIVATSGKKGPVLAMRPGGRGDVTSSHVVWRHEGAGPYVCSPLIYDGLLYVHDEAGILDCYQLATGERHYRERLDGKFLASAVAAAGRVYFTSESGETWVIRGGPTFELLARNALGESSRASPAIVDDALVARTEHHLWCLSELPAGIP